MKSLKKVYDEIVAGDAVDLVLILSLVLVMVNPGPAADWILRVLSVILGVAGLASPTLRRLPVFWVVVGAVFGFFYIGLNWHFSDNHKFVVTYWCFTVACCLKMREQDQEEAFAWCGRIIVGLVFGIAAFWKATSLAYLKGHSFYVMLLTDDRFFALSHILGGQSVADFEANRLSGKVLEQLAPAYTLTGTDRLWGLAYFLTWWTLVIEIVLAVMFLWPKGKIAEWRHYVLVAFIATTYPPTNVIQFGWILIIMALASCPREMPRTRFAYVAAFLFIFCFSTGVLRSLYYQWVS